MKYLLLSILISFGGFSALASNKICVGENIIVVFNENLKKLSIHDKETMEVLQADELEGRSFGEIALSTDGTKLWFQIDDKMYCRDVNTGELLKELHSSGDFKYELSAADDYLIHFETIEQHSLIYVYDLNSTQAVAYAKVDFTESLETIHYDHKRQKLHLLSSTRPTKKETAPKEPTFGLPQSAEQVALEFLHDQEEMRYMVFDITTKKSLFDAFVPYSPDSDCNFEVIGDKLYIITGIGTAEVLEDYSFKLTSLVVTNLSDYDVLNSELVGTNDYFAFSNSFEDNTYKKWDSFDANLLLIEADAIAVTETDYYVIKEGIFYRFKRSEPRNVDFEIAMD